MVLVERNLMHMTSGKLNGNVSSQKLFPGWARQSTDIEENNSFFSEGTVPKNGRRLVTGIKCKKPAAKILMLHYNFKVSSIKQLTTLCYTHFTINWSIYKL